MKEIEECVLCNKLITGEPTPIELDDNYIDGGGRICDECKVRLYNRDKA